MELELPDYFCDPITLELMQDPVLTPSGHTFCRASIMLSIQKHGENPITREKLTEEDLIPNVALKKAIEQFKDDNSGVYS